MQELIYSYKYAIHNPKQQRITYLGKIKKLAKGGKSVEENK
ncbi:MAG TPA: hypothetical protein VFD10_07165 [Atribacterota bacterium]|nr:hypothetical protein [Atribacterota bacterium]